MKPLLAALLITGLAFAQAKDEPKEKLLSPAFEDTWLTEVFDWLQREAGFEYTLTKEAQKIARRGMVKVALNGTDLTAVQALTQVLDSLGLAFTQKIPGRIRIMTRAEFDKDNVLELYDIKDLLVPIHDFEGPEVEMGGGSARFKEPAEPEKKKDPKPFENPDQVPALVKDGTGGDEAWIDGTSITFREGMLFVKAPARLQAKVQAMLDGMRAMK